eukprot:3996-Heterococcus_DN1.PRE.7
MRVQLCTATGGAAAIARARAQHWCKQLCERPLTLRFLSAVAGADGTGGDGTGGDGTGAGGVAGGDGTGAGGAGAGCCTDGPAALAVATESWHGPLPVCVSAAVMTEVCRRSVKS